MILKRIQTTVGIIGGANCYVVHDEKTKETIVIDPGNSVELIIKMLMAISADLKYIVLTHCHGDHIAGVEELKERMGGKVLVHIEDEPGLKDPNINLSEYIGIRSGSGRSR